MALKTDPKGNIDKLASLRATREERAVPTTQNLPAIRDVDDAPLPQRYEAAKVALSECSRIDECKTWADKAAALASYARQADDDALHQFADRIRARAVRRTGELLKAFKNPGVRTDRPSRGTPTRSQREAAKAAGMSKDQEVTAVRVANVPESEFEAAVESGSPPSVTKLAEIGRTPRPGFAKATHLIGSVRRFAEFCSESGPESVASGVLPEEIESLAATVTTIEGWLSEFRSHLTKREE